VKATFYLSRYKRIITLFVLRNGKQYLLENATWTLVNHSLFIIDGRLFDWVHQNMHLNNYTLEQIRSGIILQQHPYLKAVDGKTIELSGILASNFKVQDAQTYVDVVKELFSAARSDGPVPTLFWKISTFNFIATLVCRQSYGQRNWWLKIKKWQEKKRELLPLYVHSVEVCYLNVSNEALREILLYLKRKWRKIIG